MDDQRTNSAIAPSVTYLSYVYENDYTFRNGTSRIAATKLSRYAARGFGNLDVDLRWNDGRARCVRDNDGEGGEAAF